MPITTARYNDMKNTLYLWLAQRTIIGAEHTDLRNIINRHAIRTDGYLVLYEIMERIHPALAPDVVFSAPQSSDYSDIHEYYTYLTSYHMHEQFAGRYYKPREQVNHFLNGLDPSYKPAIKRIRSQMDSWKLNDPVVPDNLILANLPNLVDRYMEEDGGTAIVRRTEKEQLDTKPKSEDAGRNYVDVLCPLCKTHGHVKYNCDRMAIWLNLKEGSQLVDDKLRKKLLTNYAAVDAKRRTKKLSKVRGTVRQLFQTGQYVEGEQLLNTTLPLPTDRHNGEAVSESDCGSSQAS